LIRRRKLTKAQRRDFYIAAKGEEDFPRCNICGEFVLPGQAWDESHEGAPHALGGTRTGIAHRRCNRDHGAQVVTPMVAKAKRLYDKHRGIHVSRYPMRDPEDPRKRTMDGRVIDRRTGELWGGRNKEETR
jgi:hypothetical protein